MISHLVAGVVAAFFGSATPAAAAPTLTAEQVIAAGKRLVAPPACEGSADEIVVCGRRTSDAFRVPPADERGEPGDVRGRAGEVPSASPERLNGGRCGIFAGERRCGKAEAKLYGYFGGRDPISVAVKLGEALLDPD